MFAWQNNLFSFQYLFLKRLYTSDEDGGHDEEMAKCLLTYNRGALNDHGKEPTAEKVTQPMGTLPFVLLHLGSRHKADTRILPLICSMGLSCRVVFAVQRQSASLARTWVTLERDVVA